MEKKRAAVTVHEPGNLYLDPCGRLGHCMNMFAERLSQGTPLLWLEYDKYAGNLLGGGHVPWLYPDALIGWQKKAAGLLPTDVISLPVADIMRHWVYAHPPLLEAMAAKRRTGAALRVVLADTALRQHFVELATALRTCFSNKALALVLPSPAALVAQSHALAFPGETAEVDLDLVDSASVYVADFLREFSDCGIDVLLLEEGVASAPFSAEMVDLYGPLLNLANHYRWSFGIRVPDVPPSAVALAPDFWIANATSGDVPVGLHLGKDFWGTGALPRKGDTRFIHVEVPADENPEHVLERLATLR